MKKTYISPTITVVRVMHHQPLLLISSTGNDKEIEYGGQYEGMEEPR